MKKLFLASLLAATALLCVAPSQKLSAQELGRDRSSHKHSDRHRNVYGSFYTTETGTDIAAGGYVPFELVATRSSGVNISGGNICIQYPGDYLVTYGVALGSPAEFQLQLNSEFIPGTQQAQGPGIFHPFSTIIHTCVEGSILSVVAVTETTLQNTYTGDTTAYLTIVKVN